jgi:hypothetical protein
VALVEDPADLTRCEAGEPYRTGESLGSSYRVLGGSGDLPRAVLERTRTPQRVHFLWLGCDLLLVQACPRNKQSNLLRKVGRDCIVALYSFRLS